MGIIFKLYAWVWTIILLLYHLNWSEFSQPLDKGLLFFLIFTIIVSFILGYLLKPYRYNKNIFPRHNTKIITCALWIGFILNFIYARYIPFLALINGNYSYVEFEGIPTLFPFLYTFSLFYFFYLIYYFFITTKRTFLIQALSLFLIFLSFFSRSLLVFALLGTALIKIMTYKKHTGNRIKFNLKNLFIIFFIIIVVCYMFGVLGNIRVGLSWNDCSFIERIGLYENYPEWLPKQFMWLYSYLISPLANLNYNVIQNNCTQELSRFLVCFVPEFISKRFFPALVVSSESETLLIRSYFNAQTAYVDFYYSYGVLGCYISYMVLAIIGVSVHCLGKIRKIYTPIMVVVLGIFITMTFFYNVFYYTLTSLLLIWCIMYIFLASKKRIIKFIFK